MVVDREGIFGKHLMLLMMMGFIYGLRGIRHGVAGSWIIEMSLRKLGLQGDKVEVQCQVGMTDRSTPPSPDHTTTLHSVSLSKKVAHVNDIGAFETLDEIRDRSGFDRVEIIVGEADLSGKGS